MSQLFYVGG